MKWIYCFSYPLRGLWLIGLLPAGFAFMVIINTRDGGLPAFAICLAYFAFGYWLYKIAPKRLANIVLAQVAPYKSQGFNAKYEVVSTPASRYFGFDVNTRRALFVVLDCPGVFIDADDLLSWETRQREWSAEFKILTRRPDLPVIQVGLHHWEYDKWSAYLSAIFDGRASPGLASANSTGTNG